MVNLDTLKGLDFQTISFILTSWVVLVTLQSIILQLSSKVLKLLLLASVHFTFGYLLVVISSYHVLVHFILYLLPTLTVAWAIHYFRSPKKQNGKTNLSFVFRTTKGKRIEFSAVFRSFAVIGGAGSGKTKSFVKPTIKQMAENGFCGVIYDYKKMDLAKTAYTHYLDSPVEFKGVNFFNLSQSSRINPVSPKIITSPAYANEAAHVFIANLSKMSKNTDPWFVEAAESALAATIWKFRDDLPEKCFLPYIASLLMLGETEQVARFVSSNNQSQIIASPYLKIIRSDKQASAVEGTLANALRKIALPEIFWVLSGDEINFNLNDTNSPTLLCLSNYMKLDATYAPIISLIINMCAKSMSEPGRQHSGFIIEEGSTIYLPNLAKIPATLREYMVFVMFCIQDITQGEILYDKLGIKSLLSNLGNHLYGRVMDMDTAERYAKMYGKIFRRFTSRTRRTASLTAQSYTESDRQMFIKEPNEFMHLNPGEFFGLIAEGNKKTFDARFKEYNEPEFELPKLNDVTEQMVQYNFHQIVNEVKELLNRF